MNGLTRFPLSPIPTPNFLSPLFLLLAGDFSSPCYSAATPAPLGLSEPLSGSHKAMATVSDPVPVHLLSSSSQSLLIHTHPVTVHHPLPHPDPKPLNPQSVPFFPSPSSDLPPPPPPPPPPPLPTPAPSSEALPSAASHGSRPSPRAAAPPPPSAPPSSSAPHLSSDHPPASTQPSSSHITSFPPQQPVISASPPVCFGPSPNPSSDPGASALPLPDPILPTPSPAPSIPGHDPVPHKSYAQAARFPKGTGFVRSHASDVESFARLPRTGVNVICGSKEGIPSFSFVSSDLPTVDNLFANALVMKFHGGRPSLEVSHREIQSWGLEHPFTIGPLTSRAFLLRFQDHKDLIRVLTRPSTLLITYPYKIFRWHNLGHINVDSCYAPVWISLPRLPLQCFIPEFLEAAANKIGRFLCLDKATATLARPSAARLCVEIDLRKSPPPFIWVGLFEGLRQPIIYERMPKFCNICQAQGHLASVCSKGHRETRPTQAEPRQMTNQSRPPPARHNVVESSPLQQHTQPTTPRPPASHHHTPRPGSSTPQHQQSAVPPPPPQSSSAVLVQISPAAAVQSISSAPPPPPSSRPAAAAPPADHVQQIPVQQSAIPSTSFIPHTPQPSSNHVSIPCTLCLVPGHSSRDCPSGHREAISKQADPHPSSPRGGTPPVRQIASKKFLPTSEHQHTSLTTNHGSSTTSPPPTSPYPKDPAATFHVSAPNSTAETVGQPWASLLSSSPEYNPYTSLDQISNMNANQLFWYVVNHQLAINEQARLKAPSVNTLTTVPQSTHTSDDSSSRSSIAADSQPNSPSTTIQGTHSHYDCFEKTTYGSEGEAPTTEPTSFIGHNTDDMIWQRPRHSKRNKRHPDQPLKVQLRARKSKTTNP